ncbi:hypothetical protein IEQ34_009635 [Dendrobium chrysotoxum]|uniref:RmlD-like substrate binding domain-containing protein n=1 Tax=Dendrobium chrysotoxum TaxID=161865 RepID=A0AAV7GJM8_DENCH|nr:hypothetical protein IEQ34_009635 [Dendrobium chrysotoxum]
MKMAERKRVLVIGGSGYLGQHLLDGLATADSETPFDLAFTHHCPIPPPELIDAISPVLPFRVDVRTGEGFESISNTFGKPHVVVNCAALSVPRACEVDPVTTMATNLPTSLVNWLSSFKDNNILLIHLSTDQVYEGSKSFYKEEDETAPVNISIIYGPQTLSPVSKSLPIQDSHQWGFSSLLTAYFSIFP